jgi:hypothetical protein
MEQIRQPYSVQEAFFGEFLSFGVPMFQMICRCIILIKTSICQNGTKFVHFWHKQSITSRWGNLNVEGCGVIENPNSVGSGGILNIRPSSRRLNATSSSAVQQPRVWMFVPILGLDISVLNSWILQRKYLKCIVNSYTGVRDKWTLYWPNSKSKSHI